MSRTPSRSIRVALTFALAMAGCNREPPGTSPAAPPPVSTIPGGVTAGSPANAAGSPNLATDGPAAGRIAGQEFRPDRVEFDGDQLTLRQGKEFFADREIKLLLNDSNDKIEGLKIDVKAEAGFGNRPHINMSWRVPGERLPKNETFMDKYTLLLELGKIEDGKLPGKISLKLPDKAESFVAGAFTVDASQIGSARVHGKVLFRGQEPKSIALSVGFIGFDAGGKLRSGHVGYKIAPREEGFVSSLGTRLESSPKDGVTFHHVRLLPGAYLVYVAANDSALDGRWIEVKDRSDNSLDLTVDLTALGGLEVTIPAGSSEQRVEVIPLPAAGQSARPPEQLAPIASQLGFFVKGLAVEAAKGQTRASFTGLRAGAYRVIMGKAQADVVIKAGETATATLKAEK